MNKRFLSLLLIITIIFSIVPSFNVYARDINGDGKVTYNELTTYEKICTWVYYALAEGGQVLTLDFNEAQKLHEEWITFINGSAPEKKLSDMSESELQEVYDNMIVNLNSKGCKCDSQGNVTFSDEFLKEFRAYMDEYIATIEKPMYNLVEVPSLNNNTLKASMCYKSYIYDTIKFFVETFGDCIIEYTETQDFLCVIPLGNSNKFDYFALYYDDYHYMSGSKVGVYFTLNDGVSEKNVVLSDCYEFSLYNGIPISSLNDTRIKKNTNGSHLVSDFRNDRYGFSLSCFNINGKTLTIDSHPLIVTKADNYIKVFTSLANYQDYSRGSYEPSVFYTSNYFTTNNIQQSPVTLDMMVKLYESYDQLCKNILQYVKDTQNATDTMVVKKLDELIKAVYVSGGGSSTDMTETNGFLGKILDKLGDILKAIHNIKIDNVVITDNDIKNEYNNMLNDISLNPEVQIGNLVGSLSAGLNDTVTVMKKKFPFSLPWDLAFLIEFLADTPETPKFILPFKIGTVIDTELEIDFSHFEDLHKVSRMLLTMLYMIGLLHMTTKIVEIRKED